MLLPAIVAFAKIPPCIVISFARIWFVDTTNDVRDDVKEDTANVDTARRELIPKFAGIEAVGASPYDTSLVIVL